MYFVKSKNDFVKLIMLFSSKVLKNLEFLYRASTLLNSPFSSYFFNAVPTPKKPGTFCFNWLQDPTKGMALKSEKTNLSEEPLFDGLLPILVLA